MCVSQTKFSMEWFEEKSKDPKYGKKVTDAEAYYSDFQKRFSLNKLKSLRDHALENDDLIKYLFLGWKENGIDKNNLSYILNYIDVAGGINSRPEDFGLYYGKKEHSWMAVSGGKRVPVDVITARDIGLQVCNVLIEGAEKLSNFTVYNTPEDYRKLFATFSNELKGYLSKQWYVKYLHSLYPEVIAPIYSASWIENAVSALGMKQDENIFVCMGQLNIYRKDCCKNSIVPSIVFGDLIWSNTNLGEKSNQKKSDGTVENTIGKDNGEMTMNNIDKPRNRIFFGAPGTGKSFQLSEESKDFGERNVVRVTFHPDYTYANFVGSYKPYSVSRRRDNSECDRKIISILMDEDKKAQEKYNILLSMIKNQESDLNKSWLPMLIALFSKRDIKSNEMTASDLDHTPDYFSGDISKANYIKKFIEPLGLEEKSSDIEYRFIPGPFLQVYVKAIKNPKIPQLLIIEEINRARVSAVFGDVFQLLDRKADDTSQYPIATSEDVKDYLERELPRELYPDLDYSKISLPANMYIWATMNSADQGVFPMDTAFKRRWEFKYIGINESVGDIKGKYVKLAHEKQKVEWNKIRMAINNYLADNNINEDKQLGPFFISKDILAPEGQSGDKIDSRKFIDTFKDKVIMYLFEDAAKQKRIELFSGCGKKRYSEICEDFENIGVRIFAPSVVKAMEMEELSDDTKES